MASVRGNYQRGRDTRRQIIDATRAVIGERGVYGTSVGVVAQRSGLTRAGVLHHFPSREHLLLAAMKDRFEENRPWFAEQIARLGVLDATVALTRRLTEDPETVRLLVFLAGASIEPEHPAHDWFVGRYNHIRGDLADAVAEGQARGEVRAELDPSVVALQLTTNMEGLLLQWLHDRDAIDAGATMEAIVGNLRPS